ncbi:MFS transporter [Paraburkholderia sp. RP-4-7]|uniref:MFS transporter n=1 Tax=Paraburkholderia polaris TaxID=2728848 RepID=A0A848IWC4_9BURK|nr:MFS transporter [Paraburkholderia polaris]NMM04459.1 MFS transporter [Paraburkholderia polaris]
MTAKTIETTYKTKEETKVLYRTCIYILIFLLASISYVDRVVISVAAPSISREFGLSPVAMGYLLSSFLWGYVLCVVPFGMWIDRVGAKLPISVGVAVWSLATVGTGLAASFPLLLCSRLLLGGGEAAATPGVGRVIREWVPVKGRGVAFALYNSGFYAGPAIGAVSVAALMEWIGWRGTFAVCGLIGLVWLAFWLPIYRNAPSHSSDEAVSKPLAHAETSTGRTATLDQFKAILSSGSMWGVFVGQGTAVYAQYLFLSWLPSYLQATRHVSIMKMGFYTSVPYVVAVVVGLTLSRLSDRILNEKSSAAGKRRLMSAASIISASVILFIPLVQPLWLVLTIMSISLAAVATAVGLNFALLTDLVSKGSNQGKAMAILTIGANGFGLMAPIVTGYVIAATGNYNWAFVIAGLLLITGSLAVLTARRPIG